VQQAIILSTDQGKEVAQCLLSRAANRLRCLAAISGPATSTAPIPGTVKKAAPYNRPQMPPQKPPNVPQYFMRSPAL
jgi:hypothetical protein